VHAPIAMSDGVEVDYFDASNGNDSQFTIEFEFEMGISGGWEQVSFFFNNVGLVTITKDDDSTGSKWLSIFYFKSYIHLSHNSRCNCRGTK